MLLGHYDDWLSIRVLADYIRDSETDPAVLIVRQLYAFDSTDTDALSGECDDLPSFKAFLQKYKELHP